MRRFFLVLLLIALAGCVRYESQTLAPAQLADRFRARTLDDPGLRQFVQTNLGQRSIAWPPRQFDLKSLTLAALYFHPDLQIAAAKVATAQAGEITAGARLNPTISFLPTWVENSFPDETPWIIPVSPDIPIETAGKRKRRVEAAAALTKSARLDLAAAAWTVRSRLRASLVEYFTAERSLELARGEARLQLQLTNLLARRWEAGEASQFELSEAQSGMLESLLAERSAETRSADARIGVAEALGVPVEAVTRIELVWSNFDQPPRDISLDGLISVAAFERVDITRALAQFTAADAALRVEIAKQYPDIHLDPGYEYDQGQHNFSIGPTIAIPLFDRNQGPIAEAKARRQEAAQNFIATQQGAIQDFEKAAADYHLALAEWDEAAAVTDNLTRHIETATERQLKSGEEDRLALYYTQLQQFTAKEARLDALRKVQDALGALENAIQWPLFDAQDWAAASRFTGFPVPKEKR